MEDFIKGYASVTLDHPINRQSILFCSNKLFKGSFGFLDFLLEEFQRFQKSLSVFFFSLDSTGEIFGDFVGSKKFLKSSISHPFKDDAIFLDLREILDNILSKVRSVHSKHTMKVC